MASIEQAERVGGVGVLGIPTFDFCVWALDTYTRGELLVELHEHLPRFLINPAFGFLCMCTGLGLLYLSHQRQLRRILTEPTARLVGVDEYRKNEKPGWLLPLIGVFGGVLLITTLLAVAYSLAFKGMPPLQAHLRPPEICKTVDCFPPTHTPRIGKAAPIIVNAPGGIPIIGNLGMVNNPTVNNYAPPRRELLKEQCGVIQQELQQKQLTVMVGTFVDIPDGYDYALDLLNCFKSVGLQVTFDRVMYMIAQGPVFTGIRVWFHGQQAPAGTISEHSPEGTMIKALVDARLGDISADMGPNVPESQLYVIVGKQPKQP